MDLNEISIKTNKPYPEIVDADVCNKTVGVLKDLVNCNGGELNSILQFIYQSTIADSTDADLGELFEEIAIVNMTHTGLLMHAIVNFGGLPKYEDSNGNTFNASCVRYPNKLKDMLELNITMLENGIKNYHQAINLVNNSSLKNLLTRIVEDKHKQQEALSYIKNKVKFLSV